MTVLDTSPPSSGNHDRGEASLGARVANAISILLAAVAEAAARAQLDPFREAAAAGDATAIGQRLYNELLCVALRVVFIAHAEDRGMLPLASHYYTNQLSLYRLRIELCARQAKDSQALCVTFDGWQRLQILFATVHGGLTHKKLTLPARGGMLFGPNACPFVDRVLTTQAAQPNGIDDQRLLAFLDELFGEQRRGSQQALDVRDIGSVYESAMGGRVIDQGEYHWALASGSERRRTGSHYTPEHLTRPIVERALAPHVASGSIDEAQRLLSLRICDPAMGSGAFLVEACLQLSTLVAKAWQRSGDRGWALIDDDEIMQRARRLVAVQCLYGVDINPLAVELAKLSLWLVTEAIEQPFTFLDHALKVGNSLIGLTSEQLQAGQLTPSEAAAEERSADGTGADDTALMPSLHAAANKRREALALGLSSGADPLMQAARRRLLSEADTLLTPWHQRADAILAGFFENAAKRDPHALGDGRPPAIAAMNGVHWPLAFPEAFVEEQHGQLRWRGMDVFVGNPPFLGGKRISSEHGHPFAAWLCTIHRSSKNVDLSAHFLRRAASLAATDATLGMITTNTLAQGDTRRDGLMLLLQQGWSIYYAHRSHPWPGDAVVKISICCLGRGSQFAAWSHKQGVDANRLDGRSVPGINSLLRAGPELPEPRVLRENAGLCFIGCFLRGKGFVLADAEGQALHASEPEVVRPFLGGEEVNHSPSHTPHRFVIDFDSRSLNEARAYPQSFAIIEERVHPVRQRLGNTSIDRSHKRRWWQFANPRPELRRAISGLSRCLVAARVTKHLCFSFQPIERVFSDQLCVFASDDDGTFAVLQSRIHDAWVRHYASTLGEGLRYTPSDCVETFPFPNADPKNQPAELATLGKELYRARAQWMSRQQHGLTQLYNDLRQSAERAPGDRLQSLRELHHRLDSAVLAAYGWDDISAPPYPRDTSEAEQNEARFYQLLVERLHALNHMRHASEQTEAG